MPNPANEQAQVANLGIPVVRASATLPQTTAHALFTIAGGRVLMTAIIGEITVVMGAVPNNTSMEANPTTGTTLAICAVLNTANYAVGDLLSIDGVFANAMLPAAPAGVAIACSHPVILQVGTLDLRCAANNTGEVTWTMYYIPLAAASIVTAA